MKEIDARGLACPEPVLQVKGVLEAEHPEVVRVIVDNAASQQNVTRFLTTSGFTTTTEQKGTDYEVIGTASGQAQPRQQETAAVETGTKKLMVMVATDRMGSGDDELGKKLMVNFIRTLEEMGPELWRLVFVNNGVKLTIDGSEVLADLKAYETQGRYIMVCGTCLTHFGLMDQKRVGETTNMLDIVTAMQLADQVINI